MMPELKCTVQTCAHNSEFYCNLDAIKVEGNAATKAVETCCGSFEEKKENIYSNTTKEASACSRVDCKAMECVYNDECACHAGKISVEGSSACDCGQTECASFKCS